MECHLRCAGVMVICTVIFATKFYGRLGHPSIGTCTNVCPCTPIPAPIVFHSSGTSQIQPHHAGHQWSEEPHRFKAWNSCSQRKPTLQKSTDLACLAPSGWSGDCTGVQGRVVIPNSAAKTIQEAAEPYLVGLLQGMTC